MLLEVLWAFKFSGISGIQRLLKFIFYSSLVKTNSLIISSYGI